MNRFLNYGWYWLILCGLLLFSLNEAKILNGFSQDRPPLQIFLERNQQLSWRIQKPEPGLHLLLYMDIDTGKQKRGMFSPVDSKAAYTIELASEGHLRNNSFIQITLKTKAIQKEYLIPIGFSAASRTLALMLPAYLSKGEKDIVTVEMIGVKGFQNAQIDMKATYKGKQTFLADQGVTKIVDAIIEKNETLLIELVFIANSCGSNCKFNIECTGCNFCLNNYILTSNGICEKDINLTAKLDQKDTSQDQGFSNFKLKDQFFSSHFGGIILASLLLSVVVTFGFIGIAYVICPQQPFIKAPARPRKSTRNQNKLNLKSKEYKNIVEQPQIGSPVETYEKIDINLTSEKELEQMLSSQGQQMQNDQQ